jgi:hypothetical protein
MSPVLLILSFPAFFITTIACLWVLIYFELLGRAVSAEWEVENEMFGSTPRALKSRTATSRGLGGAAGALQS